MGLDMYLSRKTYVKNWGHQSADQRYEIIVKKGGQVRTDIKPERISYVIEQVAYWRKANAIHKWFVDNCQGGTDDCRDACVSGEQIAQLIELCKQVLGSLETVEGEVRTGTSYYPDGRIIEHTKPGTIVAQQGIADQMLPTQGGFFFGNTDYNEYYLDDLRSTIEQLEPLLTDGGEQEYEYRSSW